MTAYVHIGTPKTGTTSIQNSLHYNNEVLAKQNVRYSQNVVFENKTENEYQHWFFVSVVDSMLKKFNNEYLIILSDEIKIVNYLTGYLAVKWKRLQDEIKKHRCSFNFIRGNFIENK
ncbi:TPA: hypothetical protein R1734_001559 [Campylobacter lari]|nr:hypothetical protein [Campylobacter lari]